MENEAHGLYTLHDRPDLGTPVMVVASEGWIDAGMGGATAVAALLEAVPTEVIATFDADALLDYRSRRPVSRLIDGVYDDLAWPEITLRAGRDDQGNGVLVLSGAEPDHLWEGFAEAVAELGSMFAVRLLVGLGAFPAPVPHTRPSRLAATATTAELANEIGVVKGTVSVPAGVLAAIERRMWARGVHGIGIWARVPHYAASMPYPEASVLLLEGLAKVAGIQVDTAELKEGAEETRRQLDELMANSVPHMTLVHQLEAQFDADEENESTPSLETLANLSSGSGEDLVAEVERFLREEGQPPATPGSSPPVPPAG